MSPIIRQWASLSFALAATSRNDVFGWGVPRTVHMGLRNSQSSISRINTKVPSTSGDLAEGYPDFRWGQKIQIEVASFGPLGASVVVIGVGHASEDVIPESDPPLGYGLILQKEIGYFRQARNNVDVVAGEVLPAYIERVREDGKLDITLRAPGGKAKAEEIGEKILERLEWTKDGTLSVGDKSSPEEIAAEFPGVSKSSFKKAVAALFKKGLVKPGPKSISIMK